MYFAFLFARGKSPIYQTNNDSFIGLKHVTKDVFNKVTTKIKNECEGTTWHFVVKLEQLFLKYEVMTTFGLVYPPLWAMNLHHAKDNFHIHLTILKATFIPFERW